MPVTLKPLPSGPLPDLGFACENNLHWDPDSSARERMALLWALYLTFQGTAEYLPAIVRTFSYDPTWDRWARAYHARGVDVAPTLVSVSKDDNCLVLMARLKKVGYTFDQVMRGIGYALGDLATETAMVRRTPVAAEPPTRVSVVKVPKSQPKELVIPIVEVESE